MATPIWALAAAICRSAAAISGRRSNSCDGTPTGMEGTFWHSCTLGMANDGAGLPIRVAMACSSWARCTPRSMAVAWLFLSWVSARAMSFFWATPAA